MSKPHILVTGSSGYLGSHLLNALAQNNNYDLTGLDVRTNTKNQGSIRFVEADLNNIDLLNKTLDGVNLICHCASLGGTTFSTSSCTDKQFQTTNINGTQNLYHQAKKKV